MNSVANAVLNEMNKNSSVDAEQILAKGVGKSDVEIQFYIESARHLNLIGGSNEPLR